MAEARTNNEAEIAAVAGIAALLETIQTTKLDDNMLRENAVWSPLALYSSIASLAYYATAEAAEELSRGLHYPNECKDNIKDGCKAIRESFKGSPDVKVTCRTKLFFHDAYKISPNFARLADSFGHQLANVRFTNAERCLKQMNGWVKAFSEDRINTIIYPNEIHKDLRLVVANVTYVCGEWQRPFSAASNEISTFEVAPQLKIRVEFMRKYEKMPCANIPDLRAHTVALSLKGGRFVLLLIVPKTYRTLEDLEDQLMKEEYRSPKTFLDRMSMSRNVLLCLPKFKVDCEITWKLGMQERLGVRRIFEDGQDVFRGVVDAGPKGNLHVSEVFQRVEVEVEERGLCVGSDVEARKVPEANEYGRPFKVLADKPFLFRLVDVNTMTVVLAGRVTRPEEIICQSEG